MVHSQRTTVSACFIQHPNTVKLSTPIRRLLLVAASDEVESDFLVALNMLEVAQSSPGVFELAFFCLQRDADFFFWDILHLLNLLRDGFFEAVYLIPPAASWSRLRSSTTPGQLPLRSRAEPLGLSSLDPQQTEKVRQSNREMEAVSWFAAQSARCKVRRVGVVLIFPEDFGGHVRDGPASPWSSREFQDLEGACDVRRGSAFLCQLASTDQRRPVGILTNLPTLQNRLSLQWPILERCGDELFYQGPLPESCPCVPAHAPFKGTDAEEHFVSPSPSRWAQCSGQFAWPISTCTTSIPLGMEFHSDMQISVPRFHSLRLPIPEPQSMTIGWTRRFRVLCYLTFGSSGQVDSFLSVSSRSQLAWWSCFSTPLGSLLWVLRCRRLLPRRCLR